MQKFPYYAITVRRYNVLFRHTDWLKKTQELYNEILLFYYRLYLETFPNQQPGTQEALRILETLTIVGRDKQPVPTPLPWKKIPLYFRRAAINTATAAAKSYLARGTQEHPTEKFTESVTFYKGMYRDFQDNTISLKLWNGESWQWSRLRLRGNTVPEAGQMMSPALVLTKDRAELHIPWKLPVSDGRSARERITAEENICSVVFTGQDTCAVCCILNADGRRENSFFIKGGSRYAGACRQITEKLDKSREVQGGGENPRANAHYWERLRNIHDHYAHQFSRQIIDYCKTQNARILVLPEFDKDYSQIILAVAGRNSPIRLIPSIREKLKYKAWQEGIVVVEIQQHQISSVCSQCGAKIRRKGGDFLCQNGHRGNRYLNMAHNLGQKCLDGFAATADQEKSK